MPVVDKACAAPVSPSDQCPWIGRIASPACGASEIQVVRSNHSLRIAEKSLLRRAPMQTPDTFSSSPLQLPNGDLSSYSDAHPPAVATIARMDVDGTDEESPEALKAKNARLREENALLTKKLAKSQAKAHQVTQFVALYKEQSTGT